MADGGSGNLPAPTGGGTPSGATGDSGPPPVKRLPDGVTTEGPKMTAGATGSVTGDTASGSAYANSQLGSYSGQNGGTTAEGKWGYAGASASGSITRTPDGYSGGANAAVGGGLLSGQATNTLPGGLGSTSTKGSVMSGEAEAGGTFKLTRDEATLTGKLGAGAALYEVQAKGELVLTPQRAYNGIIVNGVNSFSQWAGFSYRMKEIQNAKLDHGIILSGNVGVHIGPALKAEGHVGYKEGQGYSAGGSVTASPLAGGTVGGSVGWR